MTVDELLRDAGWLQRIARHLVHEDPEDVVQDVWTEATERPPSSRENPRGWLAAALLNRARSRARSTLRRRRRDLEGVAWPGQPASPEEVTARLELQRKLAAAMAQLPDPYRHVIYARYVEGREPAEIAQMTDTPPGTVRWRLKEGLAKLRAQLDREHGGKRAAWVVVLGPLALPRRAAARTGWVLGAAVVAGLLAAFGLATSKRSDGGATASQSSDKRAPAMADRFSRQPVLVPAADGAETCPAVAPMQASLDALKAAVNEWRDLRELFEESAPNPKLEAAAQPIIDRAFAHVGPGCEHSITCRGMVCDVAFLTPDSADRNACWPKVDRSFYDHLSSGMNNLVDSGTPFYDPANRTSYLRQSQMWRFYREDAQPVPRAARPALPEVRAPGPPPTMPEDLSSECRSRWRYLASQYARIATTASERQPDQVFSASAPNPDLAGRLARWSGKVLGRSEDRLPFAVECRGSVCALRPGADDDPLAIKWQCRQATDTVPSMCFPERGGKSWYEILEKQTSGIGRLRFPRRDGNGVIHPAYFSVGVSDHPSPWTAGLAFMESFDWRGALAGCGERLPGTGTLKTMTQFREVTGHEPAPSHPEFHAGGDLAGTALGQCVIEAFRAAASQFTTPPISNGLVLYGDIKFPLDTGSLEGKLARMRKIIEEEKNRPAF